MRNDYRTDELLDVIGALGCAVGGCLLRLAIPVAVIVAVIKIAQSI